MSIYKRNRCRSKWHKGRTYVIQSLSVFSCAINFVEYDFDQFLGATHYCVANIFGSLHPAGSLFQN
jgi:hypothetical protein